MAALTGMPTLTVLPLLVFDYTNGFHDTANTVATSVATRAMKPWNAPGFMDTFGLPRRLRLWLQKKLHRLGGHTDCSGKSIRPHCFPLVPLDRSGRLRDHVVGWCTLFTFIASNGRRAACSSTPFAPPRRCYPRPETAVALKQEKTGPSGLDLFDRYAASGSIIVRHNRASDLGRAQRALQPPSRPRSLCN